MISLYQGAGIMIMSLVLFENEFLHIVSISFTALILNELIMVALEITTWLVRTFFAVLLLCIILNCCFSLPQTLRHLYMVISEVVTLLLYAISMTFLPEYFGARSFPLSLSLSLFLFGCKNSAQYVIFFQIFHLLSRYPSHGK